MTYQRPDKHCSEQDGSPSEDERFRDEQGTRLASSSRVQEDAVPSSPAAEEESLPALRQETQDLLGRLQRVAADYLNYQKRIQKELQCSRDFANEDLIKALLPVLDDMDHALETGTAMLPREDLFLVGLRLVQEKMMAILGRFGLAVIESLGKPFNPDCHCAVATDSSALRPPHVVVRELRRGYTLRGKTVRAAMVVISVAPDGSGRRES